MKNLNNLINQVLELSKQNQEVIKLNLELTEKVSKLSEEIMKLKTEKLNSINQFEQDLNDMANRHSLEQFENLMVNIINKGNVA